MTTEIKYCDCCGRISTTNKAVIIEDWAGEEEYCIDCRENNPNVVEK